MPLSNRSIPALLLLVLGACAAPPSEEASVEPAASVPEAVTSAGAAAHLAILEATRAPVVSDVVHYSFLVRLGDAPNAKIRIHRIVRERAPWMPRATANAAMFLHGDFSTFITNFAPSLGVPASKTTGMSVYLAERGIDVWGFDRRWAVVPADNTDFSDFAAMNAAQEIDDVGKALAFARATRLATGGGAERLALVGFSRGGQLAYAYASTEASRPACDRHVKALVPLDVYAEIAPEDDALRQNACASRDAEVDLVKQGTVDSDNGFFVRLGSGFLSNPSGASEIPGMTNRDAFLFVAGQTYKFFTPTPRYHLAGGNVVDGVVTGLRESPEDVIGTWFAAAAPHQSMQESADFDALWCGQAPLPVDVPLDRIRVPLFYLGAAGGFGDHGLYSTTRVASKDVTTHVIRRLDAAREEEDFGHGDILFARDAETLAWAPLAAWLLQH